MMPRDLAIARAGASCAAVIALLLPALAGSGATRPVISPSAVVLAATVADPREDDLEGDLERIRQVTRAFQNITAAHAAGYPTDVPQCVESRQGGMGHHYVHPRYLDAALDIEKPEILVYAPTPDGGLKLAGVEYVVPYSAWPKEKQAPRILGQALKQADGLQLWYLHVWVWEKNAKGVFADWNPAVKCSP